MAGRQATGRVIAAVVLAVVGATACTSSERSGSDPEPRRVRTASGLSVVVPKGWTAQTVDSAGALSVFYGDKFIPESCDTSRAFTHVGVSIQLSATDTDAGYVKRPARFGPGSGGGLAHGFADQPCESSSQLLRIIDHGRRLHVYADFGSRASARRRAEAYTILNSLRVNPAG